MTIAKIILTVASPYPRFATPDEYSGSAETAPCLSLSLHSTGNPRRNRRFRVASIISVYAARRWSLLLLPRRRICIRAHVFSTDATHTHTLSLARGKRSLYDNDASYFPRKWTLKARRRRHADISHTAGAHSHARARRKSPRVRERARARVRVESAL